MGYGSYYPVRKNIFVFEEDNVFVPRMTEDLDYVEEVKSALSSIEETYTGRRLIEKIGLAVHGVYIKYNVSHSCETRKSWERENGSKSIVGFPGSRKADKLTEEYLTVDLTEAAKPDFVNLAHELIHAYHNAMGKRAPHIHRVDNLVWTSDEEYHTIMGFPSKKADRKHAKITENAILLELGLPPRFGHKTLDWLHNNQLFFERVKLTSEVYRRWLAENEVQNSQMRTAPPPIINCSYEDLGNSNKFIMLYSYSSFNDKSERILVKNVGEVLIPTPPKERVSVNIEECPSEWQLKSIFPKFDEDTDAVMSMGFYMISSREAAAMHGQDVNNIAVAEIANDKIPTLEQESSTSQTPARSNTKVFKCLTACFPFRRRKKVAPSPQDP